MFTTGVALDYHFEAVQQLRFVCVDIDTPGLPPEKQELIGVCETTLGEIVGAKGAQVVKKLRCACCTSLFSIPRIASKSE